MVNQMRQSIRACTHCLQYEGGFPKVPLCPTVATAPLDLQHVDFTNIETTLEPNQSTRVANTLVFQDHFMKHMLAYVTPDQTAKTVARFLYWGYISMNGCLSFCLITYRWANFFKNRTIFLLKDKLSPDFCHGFFWSEENVDLNYFPTHGGVWVLVCPWNFLGQMLILIDFWQMLCHILYFLSWQMLLPRLVADLIANFWADVIVLVFWGGDIPLLADIGPILVDDVLADIIAKICSRS